MLPMTRLPNDITALAFLEKVKAGDLRGIVQTSEGMVLRIERDEAGAITLERLRDAR